MPHACLHHRLLGAIVAALAASAAVAEPAGTAFTADAATAVTQSTFTKSLGLKLVSTSVEGDSAQFPLAAGFTNIGQAIPFQCAKACTLIVNAMTQVSPGGSGQWAISPTVDGAYSATFDNFEGAVPSGGSTFVTASGTYFWKLAAGSHTFQPRVYMTAAGTLAAWSTALALYD